VNANIDSQIDKPSFNPYDLDLGSVEVFELLKDLIANETPFVDKSTNPDIIEGATGLELCVYKLSSEHPAATVARSVEGSVIESDWDQDPSMTQEEAVDREDNSMFFLVVDVTDANKPKAAASLRISDVLTGASETIQYFNAVNGSDTELPEKLKISAEDSKTGLWDVVGVMAPKEYRNGWASVWAYHALYKASIELGVRRWISCIADKEFGNLNSLGIPFVEIEGTTKASMERDGREPVVFGFYSINVDEISRDMNRVIDGLKISEDESGLNAFIANLANIALTGSTLK